MNLTQDEILKNSDLFIDRIYRGTEDKSLKGEVISKLVPGCQNTGGFRKIRSKGHPGKIAYVVLYTTMNEPEWPDNLDRETGLFSYYGDNREPGTSITDTKCKGNQLLEEVFFSLNSGKISDIPPFLIFEKGDYGRDVRFRGLAVPGAVKLPADQELAAIWRTAKDERFQNYIARFTLLDTGLTPIRRQWLYDRVFSSGDMDEKAPYAWKYFQEKGRAGIIPLKADPARIIPPVDRQTALTEEGRAVLSALVQRYEPAPSRFDACAPELVRLLDSRFTDFKLTEEFQGGGREAVGYIRLPSGLSIGAPIQIDCVMNTKCLRLNRSVGLADMSPLIARTRRRQFGVLVTTGSVEKQAYEEIYRNKEPILVLSASDVAGALFSSGIHPDTVNKWCDRQEEKYLGT